VATLGKLGQLGQLGQLGLGAIPRIVAIEPTGKI